MIGQSIGPFRVLSKLGAGGMGEVYLAEDTRLGRKVALKTASAGWLADPDTRARLQREARAAARLNHPRIAAIYDVLDLGDQVCIVMEYVEGQTLAAVLKDGALAPERAVVLGLALVDALAAAHEAGIVHRDLKPGNIVLTGSAGLKVLDFGLAKVVASAPDEEVDGFRSAPGQLLGTPGYMAPEQLLGHTADARGDIYSTGAILYEMLTGCPPFPQSDAMGRSLATLVEPLAPPHELNPAVPRDLSDVVLRAMARDPRDRYQSASDVRLALERSAARFGQRPTGLQEEPHGASERSGRWRLSMALLVLLLALVGFLIARWIPSRSGSAVTGGTAPPVVAVLPFANLTGDASLDFLGAGMADTVSTAIASVPTIAVLSRSEIQEALGRGRDPRELRRILGASFVVEGAVQKSADRLQVNMNLLGADGRIVPAGIYEGSLSNVFELQRQLAEALSERLVGALSAGERARLGRSPTRDLQALSEYWRGRALLDEPTRPGAIDEAIARFRSAIDRDPGFALAHAGLGDALWERYAGPRNESDARAALAATERARELAPDDAGVRLSLARSYEQTGRDEEAAEEGQAVLERQPNNDDAHRMLARIRARQGRAQEAITHYERAISIRPEYWRNHSSLGGFYFRTGRFAEAIQAFQRVTELQPENSWGFANLGAAYHSAGDFEKAIENYQRSIAIAPSDVAYTNLGAIYHRQGRYDDAIAAYREAAKLTPGDPLVQRNIGDAYNRQGDVQAARQAYQSAIDLAEKLLSVNPDNADALGTIALCEAKLGRFDRARERVHAAVRTFPSDSSLLARAAAVEALAGRREEAIDLLERAVAHGRSRSLIAEDDDFASLREDPRFRKLLENAR